jgi:hypothetical protein
MRSTPTPARRPRQQALITDRAIPALEQVAADYAAIRDDRMELAVREAALKATAIKLMHKYGKTVYRRDGIELRLVEGEETITVKIKKPADDDDNTPSGEPAAEEEDDDAAEENDSEDDDDTPDEDTTVHTPAKGAV